MAVAEQIDARRRRRAEGKAPLRVHLPHARRSEVDEICDRARATFLREPDQLNEDLRRRLRVRQCAVAGLGCGPEEVRKRSEPRAAGTAFEEPACEPDGVDDRSSELRAGQPLRFMVEEAEVEACVVRDEDGIAGELEEAPYRDSRMRLTAQL